VSRRGLQSTTAAARRWNGWTGRWVLPLLGLVLSACVFGAILGINRSGDRHKQAQLLISDTKLQLLAVQNAPWDADVATTNSSEAVVRAHIASTEAELTADLSELRKLAPGPELPRIIELTRENAAILDRQLSAVAAGRQVRANAESDQALLVYAELTHDLNAAAGRFESTAARDYAYTFFGTAGLLLVLYAAFITALALFRRSQRRSATITERLRQAEKLDSFGQFAGGIAHDFNNLLLAIGGYGHFLVDGVEGEQLRGYAEEIVRTTDRAAALTGQLLAFSRRQVLKLQAVDLNESVREVSTMLRSVLPAGIHVELDLGRNLALVEADPGQIGQVLMNLVLNARDAMDGSGTLTIATGNVGADVVLSVRDTGAGMDNATRAQVFEPFFTTKPTGSGTGLGLATVYGIVKQSGGEIDVASVPGRGTTFSVRLRAAKRTIVPLEARAPVLTRDLASGAERILLVDDEESVREFVTAALRKHGYTVIHTASPTEALAIEPERWDMLLTDIVMPVMSGVDLARQLEARCVLFMSGYDKQGVVADGAPFLPKPFTEVELARKVREVFDGMPDTSSAAA
jgi:signal transduction histidine kinase